jgi:two-component system, OmpR family, phosphate regulon sensor histidine kinase PhoR
MRSCLKLLKRFRLSCLDVRNLLYLVKIITDNATLKEFMNRFRWYFHPVFVFVFSILALGLSLFLYIYWYIEVSKGLKTIVTRFNLDTEKVLTYETWVVILVLSVLVGLILVGIFIIFVYSQKMVQLFRLQQNFINNFTHELRTPVTSLKLYLETFLKHELPAEDRKKYIGYMLQDAQRLSENVNRILNIAKLESKSYKSEFVDSELSGLIRRFCIDNKYLFPNCRIQIDDGKDSLYPFRVNHSLFEMLLINLLANAIKYNKSPVPEVRIHFETLRRKLKIHFEDNGIGLPKNELKKIFRKFYQVGSFEDMSAKGSGLGLYLAQHVARIHNGRIFAESQGLGRGSVFTLILPFPQKGRQ